MRQTPADYLERVYAGVLGKLIGVYVGKPFEGWSNARIEKELGLVNYYVHDRLNYPLIAADDDVSGTFTFLRALEDFGATRDLTAEQIGRTWLNYIVEDKSILWWGGLGFSTEHTAYLRLKAGIPAPRSGSIGLNGATVAEQIGSQIFIDGWGLVAPNDPQLAADLATRAASVSHDGEAIHGAVVIATMIAAAFGERDLGALIDVGLQFVPRQCAIARLIRDLRDLRRRTDDWKQGLALIDEKYNYDRYPGGCHIVPNHAVVMLGLLWGDDDFQKSLMVTNTAGYDTDCNSGNVGCILATKNGLAALDQSVDWRGPVADRMLIPTADGGGCVTDAVHWAYRVANMGRRLAGAGPVVGKKGERFHFSLPGSTQGFVSDTAPDARGAAAVSNTSGRLTIKLDRLGVGRVGRVMTMTYPLPSLNAGAGGYAVTACPTLSPGHRVTAMLCADARNPSPVGVRLCATHLLDKTSVTRIVGERQPLEPGREVELSWTIPDVGGLPITQIGLEIDGPVGSGGVIHLDSLHWDGAPRVTLRRVGPDRLHTLPWVPACVVFPWAKEDFAISCSSGAGMLIHGTADWRDYRIATTLSSKLGKAFGLAIRVQGLQRYHALLQRDDQTLALVRVLDGIETVLASTTMVWKNDDPAKPWSLTARGNELLGIVDGVELRANDPTGALASGAMALVVHTGHVAATAVNIEPV